MVSDWRGDRWSVNSKQIEIIDYDPFDEIPDELIDVDSELYCGYPREVIYRGNIVWELEPLREHLEASSPNLEDSNLIELAWGLNKDSMEDSRIGFLSRLPDKNFVFYSRPLSTDEESHYTRAEHLEEFFKKFENLDHA
jgi:hypothetical protein